MSAPMLKEIHIFPVKGCRGLIVEKGRLTLRGLAHDREWMIIDGSSGMFLTQRELPRMALIGTALDEPALILSIPGATPLRLPIDMPGATEREATCFMHKVPSLDCGDEVAAALTTFLQPGDGKSCRLVRMKPGAVRPSMMGRGSVGFVDAFALHGVSVESLAELNTRLPEPLGMDRFRPNLVFTGAKAYDEDSWKRFRIGGIDFTLDFRCPRCAVTMVDQSKGESAGPEPLKTLAEHRKTGMKVFFGTYFTHSGEGELEAGMKIEVIEREA